MTNGHVTMQFDEQGKLTTAVDLSSTNYRDQKMPAVIAYPNVAYGWNVNGGGPNGRVSPVLPLGCSDQGNNCMQLKDMPQIVSVSNYSINAGTVPMDFAYDIWMTPDKYPTNPGADGLELMVWTDYANNMDYYLKHNWPLWVSGKSVVTDAYVDGAIRQLTWDVYVFDPDKQYFGLTNHCTVVYVVLHEPINSGTIGIDLKEMVDIMAAELGLHPSKWPSLKLENYYLQEIQLGSEFGIPGDYGIFHNPFSSKPAVYSWDLSTLCFGINKGLTTEIVESCGRAHFQSSPMTSPEIENAPLPDSQIGLPILIDDVHVANLSGESISKISSNSQAIIEISITNTKSSHEVPLVIITQIETNDGTTDFMSWQTTSATPENRPMPYGFGWMPSVHGIYKVKIFVWQSLANPVPLADPETILVLVT